MKTPMYFYVVRTLAECWSGKELFKSCTLTKFHRGFVKADQGKRVDKLVSVTRDKRPQQHNQKEWRRQRRHFQSNTRTQLITNRDGYILW